MHYLIRPTRTWYKEIKNFQMRVTVLKKFKARRKGVKVAVYAFLERALDAQEINSENFNSHLTRQTVKRISA